MTTDFQARDEDDLGYDPVTGAHYGRVIGPLKATVVAVDDPEKQGRVRLHIPMLMGGSSTDESKWSDWAEPERHSGDGEDYGSCDVPPVQSTVWVSFKSGHPDYPVYRSEGFSNGTRDMLKLAKGENDGLGGQSRVVGGVTVPASLAGSSEYPLNHVRKLKSGHTVEFDDSTNARRIRVRHANGSFVEMTHIGDWVQQVIGNVLMWAGGNVEHAAASNYIIAVGAMCKLGSSQAQKKLLTDDFTAKYNGLRAAYLGHQHGGVTGGNASTTSIVHALAQPTDALSASDYTQKVVAE